MFFKPTVTRHTSAGTFRAGVVYDVDDKDAKRLAVIKPLTEGKDPVFKKLSAQQVKSEQIKAHKLQVTKTSPALAVDKRAAKVKNATELEETVKNQTTKIGELITERDDLAVKLKGAVEQSELDGESIKLLTEERSDAQKAFEGRREECIKLASELDDAKSELEEVKAQLESAKAKIAELEAVPSETSTGAAAENADEEDGK